MQTVNLGDRVRVHYASRNETGGTFETSRQRRPLEFIAGGSDVIDGVSRGVVGMRAGERKTMTVLPRHGFGERNNSWELRIPRSFLPPHLDEGDQFTAYVGNDALDVWVRSIEADSVTVDGNHPLAGEVLVIDLELVEILKANDKT